MNNLIKLIKTSAPICDNNSLSKNAAKHRQRLISR